MNRNSRSGIPSISTSVQRSSSIGINRGRSLVTGTISSRPRSSSSEFRRPSVGSRQSFIGGRLSLSKTRVSEGERTLRKDIRPLGEKTYQKKCIQKLQNYLSENAYPHPITHNLLNSPSNKDFMRMFEFMMSKASKDFELGSNPTDEIISIIKSLRYPCNINKSHLLNPGSKQSWGILLGFLTWMIDASVYSYLYKRSLNVDPNSLFAPEDTFNDTSEIPKVFYKCVPNMFSQLVNGSANEEEIQEDLFKLAEKACGCDSVTDSETLKTELESLIKQRDMLDENLLNFEINDKRNKNVEGDLKNLEKFIPEMENHIAKKEAIALENEQTLKALLLKVKEAQLECDGFKAAFEEQRVKGTNVQLMHKVKRELHQDLDKAVEIRNNYQQERWNKEMAILDQDKKFKIFCSDFDSARLKAVEFLQSNPELFKDYDDDRIMDKIQQLDISSMKNSESQLIKTLNTYITILGKLKEHVIREIWNRESNLRQQNQALSQLEGQNKILQYELEELEASFETERKSHGDSKNNDEKELVKCRDSINGVQKSIQEMQKTLNDPSRDSADVAELKESLALKTQLFDESKSALRKDLHETYREVKQSRADHMAKTELIFSQLEDFTEKAMAFAEKKGRVLEKE